MTLINRSLTLPTDEESKKRELKHVSNTLANNGYPRKLTASLIKMKRKKTTPSPKQLVKTFFDSVERTRQHSGYAVLPYIKGLTEPLKRTLGKHDIKVFSKPVTTLQQQFLSLKHRPTMEEQTNIIYKIPCKDCSWSYIGETGRSLKTRKSEHVRNVEHCKKGSNVAKHAWTHDHVIDFKNSKVIDSGSHRTRKTLESWHTALTNNADNHSMPLPRQYSMRTKKNT